MTKNIILCAAILLSLSSYGIWAEPAFTTFQCDAVSTLSESGSTVTMKVHQKGEKYRVEQSSTGHAEYDFIYMSDGNNAYMYYPALKKATAFASGSVELTQLFSGALGPKMPAIRDISKKSSGSEVVDGKLCDIYETSYKGVGAKTWIARETGLPVKTESGQSQTYYRNVVIDAPLDDALFSLPPGTQVESIEIPGDVLSKYGAAVEELAN